MFTTHEALCYRHVRPGSQLSSHVRPGASVGYVQATRTSLSRWIRTGGAGRPAPRAPRTVLGTRTRLGRKYRVPWHPRLADAPGEDHVHRLPHGAARGRAHRRAHRALPGLRDAPVLLPLPVGHALRDVRGADRSGSRTGRRRPAQRQGHVGCHDGWRSGVPSRRRTARNLVVVVVRNLRSSLKVGLRERFITPSRQLRAPSRNKV